jgi:hypothetical protein
VEKLSKETDQIKELQRQIRLLNEKVGVKDPSDLTHDIETYKWLNLYPIQNNSVGPKEILKRKNADSVRLTDNEFSKFH